MIFDSYTSEWHVKSSQTNKKIILPTKGPNKNPEPFTLKPQFIGQNEMKKKIRTYDCYEDDEITIFSLCIV
ncbi:hypothetical protein DERF_001515 [Dermatophagoides farinae]|uniref:Uncharacterized protein n=1 Tax=Dermatophagoides farinae TaxID=6954 RepID=A0A922ICE8_DERFA|nr:hypothetical protein DERF_001515 [Dermatophagoides farinae]